MSRLLLQGMTTILNFESGIESIRGGDPSGYDGFSSPADGMGWEQPRNEIIVPLQNTDGALLGFSRGSFDRFKMSNIRIFGSGSYKAAKAHRQVLLDALDLARLYELTGAGSPIYYEHGLGDDDDPDIFRVITGLWTEGTGHELLLGCIQGELTLTCTRD